MAKTFREVIDRCAVSNRQLARDLGMTATCVQKWKDRDRIPVEHWLDVIAVARRNGFRLSAEDLARIAAGRG